MPRICLCLFALLVGVPHWQTRASAATPDEATTPVVVGKDPDYVKLFDQFDTAYAPVAAAREQDNSKGRLAWLDSYLLQGYMQMYRATSDTKYLRKLTAAFDAQLAVRDDKVGKIDDYTSRALAGWGTSSYDRRGAMWHVFIVHTGMITLAPAEFANMVQRTPALQADFGTSASLYRTAIEESLRDAEPYWNTGPEKDEGYYADPGFGLMPLNQTNALACVLLEMHELTKNPIYKDHATRAARFFKNRVQFQGDRYQWAYWPKADRSEDRPEDISHAAINVDFAVRCARRGVVFTPAEMPLFARAWLDSVRRPDGSWGANLDGTGDGGKYLPGSAGRWLVLCELLEGQLRKDLYADAARAFAGRKITVPSQALGLAHLLRYKP